MLKGINWFGFNVSRESLGTSTSQHTASLQQLLGLWGSSCPNHNSAAVNSAAAVAVLILFKDWRLQQQPQQQQQQGTCLWGSTTVVHQVEHRTSEGLGLTHVPLDSAATHTRVWAVPHAYLPAYLCVLLMLLLLLQQ
jgi:hypothetical protein